MPVAHRVPQVLAAQELHHHEGPALIVFAEIVYTQNVVVRQAPGHSRFGQKPLFDVRILASRLGQNLDCDGAPDQRIQGPVDV